MSRRIWLVYGYSEWVVAAFTNKRLAEQHRAKCEQFYEQEKVVERRSYDPDMRTDYTGTKWRVVEVSLYDHLPKMIKAST